jgi:magnesium-transporting ATPase (P-type)
MRSPPQKRTISPDKTLERGIDRLHTTMRGSHRQARPARRNVMIAMSVLLMLVVGIWLAAALVGLVFKLTFALIGGLFSVIGGVLGLLFGGVALLVVAPIVALAVLPICLPAIVLVAVVWAIVRMARGPAQPVASTAH